MTAAGSLLYAEAQIFKLIKLNWKVTIWMKAITFMALLKHHSFINRPMLMVFWWLFGRCSRPWCDFFLVFFSFVFVLLLLLLISLLQVIRSLCSICFRQFKLERMMIPMLVSGWVVTAGIWTFGWCSRNGTISDSVMCLIFLSNDFDYPLRFERIILLMR